MQRNDGKYSLNSYDDIFETDTSRAENQQERIQKIPVSQLIPFKNHPFHVVDDEAMLRTTESIAQYGVLTPLVARPCEQGFEIISGHRRVHAAELAGLSEVPVIVREMDDDEATVLMVDSNLQRENILPSEKAYAYRMKMEAMKRQGKRTDLQLENTSTQVGRKLETADMIGQETGESRNQIRRYIRLTYLIPDLLEMVDNKQIAFNPAVELSYMKPQEQTDLLDAIEYAQATPSLSQAQRLKGLSQSGECSFKVMCKILCEEKKHEIGKVSFKENEIRKYFPKNYNSKQIQDTILKLLEQWKRRRERETER